MTPSSSSSSQATEAIKKPAPAAPELLGELAGRRPLTLAEALELAAQNNPTLRQAEAAVRLSEARARQATLYPNPEVGYQGEQIRGGSYGGGEQGGFVSQTIPMGGKLALRRDVYADEAKSGRISAEVQADRVKSEVTQAFYGVAEAQEAVALRRSLVEVANDAVETAHQLANVGQADLPDVLQAEIDVEQAKIDDEHAQRMYLERFRTLAAVTGKPALPISRVEAAFDSVPELDTAKIVIETVDSSPGVRQAQAEVVAAEARLKAAKRATIPDLKLTAGVQQNLERLAESPNKATGVQGFASAGVSLPLWDRNQGNIAAAQAEVERAQQDVVRERLSLGRQAETKAQAYLSARYEAERYRSEMIPRAEQARDLYRKKYEAMSSPYAPVLASAKSVLQMRLRYIAALGGMWQAATALQYYGLSGALEGSRNATGPSVGGWE